MPGECVSTVVAFEISANFGKYFLKAIEYFFHVYITSSKHTGWGGGGGSLHHCFETSLVCSFCKKFLNIARDLEHKIVFGREVLLRFVSVQFRLPPLVFVPFIPGFCLIRKVIGKLV